MEQSIFMLDDRTDPATKQMLHNVVKRKKKFDKYKQFHNLSIGSTLVLTTWFLTNIYQSINSDQVLSAFLGRKSTMFFLLITIVVYGLMNILKKQRDKYEKEYHGLRCEIVDRSKDLWKKEDEWKSRHVVFEMMKNKYDINLYHENK
jgi:hypothetical protein